MRRAIEAILAAFPLLFLATAALAHPPYGLVADGRGNLYFSDLETVWRLGPDGRLSVFRPAVPDAHVHELALAPDGAIEGDQNRYDPAAQRFYWGIWRRTTGGEERYVLPMTERPPRGIGVWQDKAGNRYTAQWRSNEDRRTALLRRRADGRVDVLFNEGRGAMPVSQNSTASVGGMAFAADGSLFFADRNVLRRFGRDGRVTAVYDGGAQASMRGLAAAPDGHILTADMGRKLVLAVATNGRTRILFRETQAWLPTAVALAGKRLFVLEANADPYDRANRVRIVEVKDGKGRVVAMPGATAAGRGAAAVTTSPAQRTDPAWAGIAGVSMLSAAGAAYAVRRARARRLRRAEAAAPGGSARE